MSLCRGIILAVVFIGAVIALEYFLRRICSTEEDKWNWDKYDTITTIVTIVLVAIIVPVAIALKTDKKPKSIEIELFSEPQWPSVTPLTTSIHPSPSPVLNNPSYHGPIESENIFSKPSSRQFQVSSPPGFSSQSTITPTDTSLSQQFRVSSPPGFSSQSVITPMYPSTPQAFEIQSSNPLVTGPQYSSTPLSNTPLSSLMTASSPQLRQSSYSIPSVMPSSAGGYDFYESSAPVSVTDGPNVFDFI